MPAPRRRNPFFNDDFFGEFERFDRLFEEMLRGFGSPEFQRRLSKEPLVYGVNIRVGPEGKPHIEQFGNVNVQERKISDEREPLVDVIEEKDVVRAIVELPGVPKEAIQLKTEDAKLTVHAHAPGQKFKKTIDLPAEVLSESSKATFKNGILEVVLKKKHPGKSREASIKVE